MDTYSQRRIAILMGLEVLSLAIISTLHLSGVLAGRGKPFNPTAAGTAEALIGTVLLLGVAALVRDQTRGREAAIAATGFAIVGFLVGLTFTVRGGDAIDIAYHATVLPLLVLTLVVLRPSRRLRPPALRSES